MAFHSLSIGTTALLSARYGLDITGQNLGNVETAGYSRQRVNQTAGKGWTSASGNGVIGSGVQINSITRVANEYIEKQLRQATTTDSYYGSLKNCYSNMQSFFNELSGNALSDSMANFWDSMSDFSTHVENIAIRTTALNETQSMVQRFNSLSDQLTQYRRDINTEVAQSVSEINRILGQIATLNRNIVSTELGGNSAICANDLRDQRGEAVKELYGYMDCDVVEEANGSFIVSLHGRNLVYFDQAKQIINEQIRSDDGTLVNNPVFASDHYPLTPKDGQLAAQVKMRDTVIKSYQDDLNTLAANFIWEFNRAYSQTRGLESFSTVTAQNGPTNPAATLDKLQYNDQVMPGTFQITNGTFEFIIHNRNTNEDTIVPIEIDLDGRLGPGGEPDMILWDPANPGASNSFINRLQKELDLKQPGVFEVTIDGQNRVSIASKTSDYGFAFGKDPTGIVAALGMNTLFTGFNARSMGLNQTLKDNPSLMGGAYSFNKGDNNGIMALMTLRDKEVANLKNQTLEGYYQGVAGRLGSEAAQASNMKALSEDIVNRMFTQRESLSGVSENEEVAKMITYQRAFQSAAKFISTMDQLYETLINM